MLLIQNLIFSIFIFFGIFNFQLISAGVTCNTDEKIPYGQQNDQDACDKHGGCWENGNSCYFSNEHISGYHMVIGGCTNCVDKKTINDIGRKDCSIECFKMSDCYCFTYNSITRVCKIKNGICLSFDYVDDGRITYNKYASKNLYCSYGDCFEPDLNAGNVNIDICSSNCRSDSRCKSIVFVAPKNVDLNNYCVHKSEFCDISNVAAARQRISSCLNGPLFPDWLTNHFTNRIDLLDNSNETCKTVGSADNFNLKIPWPTVGNNFPDFQISIIGQNLRKCFEPNTVFYENGILAYVVDEYQNYPQFTGNFKACHLKSGNDDTTCIYSCSCGTNYCESVHIRAFAFDDVNMSICQYEISS